MKNVVAALALSGMALFSGAASAAVLSFELDQISSATIGPLGVSLGTVTISDIAGGVEVDVALRPNTAFVDTGGPHTAFAFNLNAAPTSVTITEPNPNSRPGPRNSLIPLFVVLAGPQGATPYGTFSNGIDCPGCGPGASNAYAGLLAFTVMGVNVGNFVANLDGYYFSADVIGPNGATGQIAALGPVSAVPEPATWAMMLIGFAGLGFAARRRKVQA